MEPVSKNLSLVFAIMDPTISLILMICCISINIFACTIYSNAIMIGQVIVLFLGLLCLYFIIISVFTIFDKLKRTSFAKSCLYTALCCKTRQRMKENGDFDRLRNWLYLISLIVGIIIVIMNASAFNENKEKKAHIS